jgi:hypothetical protein
MRDHHTPGVDALIAEAADPRTDRAVAVGKAREVARFFATVPGTWTSSAATAALGQDDDLLVLEFVRTGLAAAEEQDDRTMLTGLMVTGTPAMRAAAQNALDSGWPAVVAFLDEPDYPELARERREQVGRILAEAKAAGNTETEAAANAALRSDEPEALQEFLESTHDTARAMDVRAKVGTIAGDDSYGTEVRNAAQVALAGTTAMQVEFLEVDRHRAAQRDYATATHDYVATSLMIETSQIAQRAVELARTAQSAAAEARGAADDAVDYANDAGIAAGRARDYAIEAVGHAQDAAASAERAAEAVRTAAAAAQQAQHSAGKASLSARWARASAVSAAQSAASAFAAYDAAYDSAIRAGESASEAARIAAEVFQHYQSEAKDHLDDLKAEWYGHCDLAGVPDDEPGYNECNAYVDGLLNDPNGPLHDPDGYARHRIQSCRDQFEGKALNTCLSVVLSPLFDLAEKGITERLIGTSRLEHEYLGLFGQDVAEYAGLTLAARGCKSPVGIPTPLGALAKGVSCLEYLLFGGDASEPNNMEQWKGTFEASWVDEDLRFAVNNSFLGPMYLMEQLSDRAILGALRESELASAVLRILPIECVQDGGDCVYADVAQVLRDVSERIKPSNNQAYIVDESGRMLDASGLPVASPPPVDDLEAWARYTVESGLHEDLAALQQRIGLLFGKTFGVPIAPPAWHVETQLAHRVAMRDVALRNGTLRIVMNNPGGVCDALPVEGHGPDDQRQVVAGCIQAVKLLLPAGTTMIIYYPDPENPGELLEVTVRGAGRWLD